MIQDDFESPTAGRRTRGAAGFATGALLSAAVTAGLALLYAPEAGEKTRRKVGRRLGALQKEALRSRPMKQAERQVQRVRARLDARRAAEKRARLRAAIIAALIGAGLGMLLAPQSGRATRRRLGEGARDASRRAGAAASRLRGRHDADSSGVNGGGGPARPVRTVQELGRDASDVF
jgi:gas vesicle protein